MTHLSSWNISYGQKKSWESNYQFDSWPLKVKNCPKWKKRQGIKLCNPKPTKKNKQWKSKFIAFRWRATYCWKVFDKGYNFALDLTSIRGLHTKLCASKVVRVTTFEISRLPLGSPRTKWNLVASPVAKHKIFYKKEVVTSSKSGSWWVLWVHVCPWWVRAPKVFQLCINQVVVCFVQVHMNNGPASQSS